MPEVRLPSIMDIKASGFGQGLAPAGEQAHGNLIPPEAGREHRDSSAEAIRGGACARLPVP